MVPSLLILYVSVKQERPQIRPQTAMKMLVRYLFSVTKRLRNWYTKTVPVGRSLLKLLRAVNVLSMMIDLFEFVLEDVSNSVLVDLIVAGVLIGLQY